MRLFFRKNPKCIDVENIENIFLALKNSYCNEEFTLEDENNFQCNDFKSFEELIRHFSNKLGVRIEISKIDETNEIVLGMPLIYEFESAKNGDEYMHRILLTPFALNNLDVAICEIIILLVDIKLSKDGYIEFEQEFIEDYEKKYRPFLVMAAFYFGLGIPLLKRYWITGLYDYINQDKSISYKYFVPLDIECMIYANSLFVSQTEYSKKLMLNILKTEFNKEIQKETKICLNHIENGNSVFIMFLRNNLKADIKWKGI